MEQNLATYERDAEDYLRDLSLAPAERAVLELLRERWPEIEMLDLGIGCGRTTYTFAALARRYVGIDYSPRMIELAKQRFQESERVELAVGDARDLSRFGGPFDFICFSANGLDSVGHEDRQKVLAELGRVSKPAGHLLFSSHSMNALPLRAERPRAPHPSRLHGAYYWLLYLRRLREVRKANRELDLDAARARGWTLVRDGVHGFAMNLCYVDPARQVEMLRDAGFETIAVYDVAGREVDPRAAGRDPWLHYYCRRA